MSQQSSTRSSSSFTTYSSMSSSSNGQTTGSRHMQQSVTDSSGTKTTTASQNLGEPVVQETRQYDTQGRELLGGTGADTGRRIEDVSDQQARNDRLYEERMEDEYAKREGGA